MTNLDERYGRTRPSLVTRVSKWVSGLSQTLIIGIVAAVLAVGVFGFWVLSTLSGSAASESIRADTLRFVVDDDQQGITIDAQINAPAGKPLACAIEARNERHAIVGWDVVELPPNEQHLQHLSYHLNTVGVPTTVLVAECWIP